MRVLQVITELSPAGAERIVADLSAGLRRMGHETEVVSLKPLPANKQIVDELALAGVSVRSLGMTRLAPHRIFLLAGMILDFEPDIIHSHLFHANLAARLARLAARSRAGLVNTEHIAERRKSRVWYFWADRLTSRLCDAHTAVSAAAARHHEKMTGATPGSLRVVYNGVNTPPTPSPVEALAIRRKLGLDDFDKVVGMVGRLDWQKGFDMILRAAPEIDRVVPDGQRWALVILGEGAERKRLESVASTLSLSRLKILMPGFVRNAGSAAAVFDLFMMPSRYEGFGLALVEAMAHGLPIIASDADSLPELLRGYGNGRILPLSGMKPESVAAAVSGMIGREKTAPSTGFSVEKMIDSYLSIYKEVIEKCQKKKP